MAWERGRLGWGWMDDHYCRGRSRNSEGGARAPTLHPQSSDANE